MSSTTLLTETKLQTQPPVSSTSSSIPSGPTKAKITFVEPPADGSAPYNYVEKQPEGTPQTNIITREHEVSIEDMRGRESSFNLDTHAFAVTKAGTSPDVDFTDDESIKTHYYPEVEQVLKKQIPTAHRVIIFDHTVRRANPNAARAPVQRAHIDQTKWSAAQRVSWHAKDEAEAEELRKGRYRIVNVWRPLNGAVESHPLAVADSGSVPDEALMPVEHRYPHRKGQTAGVKYHEGTKWYYLSGMGNDERLFLQCSDNVSGTRVPHTAFVHPGSTERSKPRESIEVRALVFG